MKIQVTADGFDLTDALSEHAHARFSAALDQHASRAVDVRVRLVDLNGPRGGVDKACEAHVRLEGLPDIIVKKSSDDAYRAITDTAEAVKRAAGKSVNRAAEHRG